MIATRRSTWNHTQMVVTAVFLGILGFYVVTALWFPMAYICATYEDLFGEWIQFWSLVVAFIVSARLARPRWRFRCFFALLSLSCFYVAMEEISWGQRLLGFSSPEFFRSKNLQGETNIHNFVAGPYATSLKQGITWALAGALAAYGLLYPVAIRWRFRIAVWGSKGLAPPPLYLWPYFLAAAVLECGPFGFNEAEVAEIFVGLALAMTALHYQLALHRGTDPTRLGETSGPPGGLAGRQGLAVAAVLVLSAATTAVMWNSASGRTRIIKRLDNGIKKFAGRYKQHDQWDVAAGLYLQALARDPDSTSIRRSLAECYQMAGREEQARRYRDEALAIGLRRHDENPDVGSVHRSLARTYRLMGDVGKADEHASKALRLDLERAQRLPESASAAYSLGKSYSMLNRFGPALEQFAKAYRIEPASKKYRKAYYSARKWLPRPPLGIRTAALDIAPD